MSYRLTLFGLLFCFNLSASFAQSDAQAIRKIDFRNHSYATCFDDEKKTTRITKGKYSREIKDGDIKYSVYFEVRDVVYGDLDGDGQEEAIVSTLCNGGGTGQFTEALIFRSKNGQPELIGSTGAGDRADGGLHDVKVVNGQLKVAQYGGNAGACCPEYIETHTYKLTGKGLVKVGKPVQSDYVNEDYAVRRVRFQRGASATTLKGATKGSETYLIGAKAGQTMSLKITGTNLQIELQAPTGADIAQPKANQPWSVKLPANGDYRLLITPTKGTATFAIEVGIK
jgi:hypothetical protein